MKKFIILKFNLEVRTDFETFCEVYIGYLASYLVSTDHIKLRAGKLNIHKPDVAILYLSVKVETIHYIFV